MKNSLVFLLILTAACTGKKAGEQAALSDEMKFEQYLVEGQRLYNVHCANCHQSDGSGLGRLYPPLAKSDYLKENLDRIGCIIKYGQNGKITVNGIEYDQPMPGIGTLTNLEIAEISTYVANSWGNEEGLIKVTEINDRVKSCEPSSSRDQ